MGKNGGARPGAGRKPGQKTKVNEAIKRRILGDKKMLPLEFLLMVMREDQPKQKPDESPVEFLARYRAWKEDRLDAAKAAAPYIHPKLESIEHKGDPDNPVQAKMALTVEFIGGA